MRTKREVVMDNITIGTMFPDGRHDR